MLNSDWITAPLGKVATLQRGYDLPHWQRKPGIVPIVTSSGTGDTHSESKVTGPGVVTGRYGTIGEVFYVRPDFWPLNTTLYVKDFHGNDPLFVSYLLRTIDFHTHSGKSGVPGVNRNDLHEIVVQVPLSKDEQKNIAEALGDADALIESMEQLITKKRHLKQGAMQELLTGKKRLPGFQVKPGNKQTGVGVIPEDWTIYSVQDLIDNGSIVGHLDGNHGALYPRSEEFKNFGVPYITANDFGNHHVSFQNCKFLTEVRAKRFRKGIAINKDVLFAHNATVGPVALLETNLEYVILSTTATYFRCNSEKLSNAFVLYLLQSPLFVRQYQAVMSQSTRNQVPITSQRKLNVVLPPTKSEQEAIATILSDMDVEIDALEVKLTKTRLLKQGMMHNLLTGRIRLV